jgi:integrase
MKGNASQSNTAQPNKAGGAQVVAHVNHAPTPYLKVTDDRKRPIRGLWVRNDRYYAQITVEEPHSGKKQVRRVPLEGATTPAQARQQLEELQVNRRRGHLLEMKRTPTFSEYADKYIEYYQQAKDAKKASTLETESYTINQWKKHLGHLRLEQIKRIHIDGFIAARQKAGKSARTVNLDVTIFRNVMKRAIDQKLISRLPTENLRPLKLTAQKRQLFERKEIEKLLATLRQPIFVSGKVVEPGQAGQSLKNGEEVADFIRLLCFSGARMAEAMRVRWPNVDWTNKQITIGADGEAKNRQWRIVDFNPDLEKHLKDMESRKAPDSDWLFPSPRRGKEDRPIKSFRESLILARTAAGMPKFGFHDCRHFFISMCVMSGIDYMTIARWVGHQDGGILIGKVYGHLSNEHAKRQATKVNFGTIEPAPAKAPKAKASKSKIKQS